MYPLFVLLKFVIKDTLLAIDLNGDKVDGSDFVEFNIEQDLIYTYTVLDTDVTCEICNKKLSTPVNLNCHIVT